SDGREDAGLEQLNTLTLRFDAYTEAETGANGTFTAQGRYEYTDERSFLIDAEILRLKGTFPGAMGETSIFEGSAGRFFFSDPSGMILAHTADGASLRLMYPKVRLHASGGYTGLLINPSSDIRMTGMDLSEKDLEIDDNFYGPKRAFGQFSLTFPELWWLNSLSLFTLAQFDLRDEDEGAVMNTQYLGVQTQRSYGKNLYQDLFLILQSGQIKDPDTEDRVGYGVLLGLRLRYLKEDFYGSRFEFRALGAPPNIATDDLSDNLPGILGFVPMNQPDLGESVSPDLSGLGLLDLNYSFRPFYKNSSETAAGIQPEIGAKGYLRTYAVTVDWIDTDPDSDSLYLGTEINAALVWRIFSDLGIDIKGAYFIPSNTISDEMDAIWSLKFNLSVSF
ncbi:MAG: hypothetical protein RBT69_13510, partial [Spirochaetia bacterium]|nr:hypothetical protein [Spirochaetia bacterium]